MKQPQEPKQTILNPSPPEAGKPGGELEQKGKPPSPVAALQHDFPTLNLGLIFRFWLPLAATWLMMAVEGPLLAALIARLPDPTFNLAAYGVTLALALLVESPIIMMMSASTALAGDRPSFCRLRRFSFALNLVITLLMGVLLLPPVFALLARSWIALPEAVAHRAHISLLLLLPWPGAIGYRRFYQGLLIRANRTRRVAYGTVVRLVAMGATAASLFCWSSLQGAYVAALALAAGVTLEAFASRLMAVQAVREVLARPAGEDSPPLTYTQITRFYMPLALTSMLSLGVQPLVTLFVGRSRLAVESLAVLPVINSLTFLFRSIGLAYQEVGIALIGKDWRGYRPIRDFALLLAAAALLGTSLFGFTSLRHLWFVTMSGLPSQLAVLGTQALQIQVLIPALGVLLSFQRSMLVNLRHTRPITWATATEVAAVAAVLWFSIQAADLVGAIAASLAMLLGRMASNLVLLGPLWRGMSLRRRLPGKNS